MKPKNNRLAVEVENINREYDKAVDSENEIYVQLMQAKKEYKENTSENLKKLMEHRKGNQGKEEYERSKRYIRSELNYIREDIRLLRLTHHNRLSELSIERKRAIRKAELNIVWQKNL
jgi:hypothetical protein